MAEQGVYVKFSADTSGLDSAVKKSKKEVSELGSELRASLSDFAKWGAAATAAGAAILGGIIVNSSAAAKELKNLAAVSNTSVSEFQKLAFAAKSVGIEQEKLSDIYKDMKDRVGDFISTGAGPMADFFENIGPKVGVTAESFRKLSGPESLQLFVSSLEKANLSQAEMTFYMEQIASDSTMLLPLLREGGAAMAEQAREAERLGIVLSDIDHQRLLQSAEAMSKGQAIAASFADQLAANLSPAVVTLGDQFADLVVEQGGAGTAAKKMADMIIDAAAFAINAVDGLKRTFEVAADGMIIFAMKLGKTILDYVTMPIRGVLELASKIPGVIGEQSTAILSKYSEITGQMTGVAAEAGKNIADVLLEPMAGDEFRTRVKDAFAKSAEEAQAAMAAAGLDSGMGMTAKGSPQDEEAAKKAEEERQAVAEKLEAMKLQHLTEQELIFADAEEKFRIAEEAKAIGLLSEEQYSEQIMEIIRKRNGELGRLDMQRAETSARTAQMEAAARKQATQQMFNDLSTLMNSGSRKAFEIGKKAAIASAVINGYEAAVAAWDAGMSTGGPWAPLVAAAYTAASLARTGATINAIRSQQFGGGGGGAPAGGGGSSATTNINAATTPANTGGNGSALEVKFTGISADRNYSGREISTIFDRLREEAGDRGMRFLPVGAG